MTGGNSIEYAKLLSGGSCEADRAYLGTFTISCTILFASERKPAVSHPPALHLVHSLLPYCQYAILIAL